VFFHVACCPGGQLTPAGRTGRIGNTGSASSFYHDRDADLAPALTSLLLEAKQEVPNFLQEFIPEGYEANKVIDFHDDSEEEGDETATAEAWGSGAAEASKPADAWGSGGAEAAKPAGANDWESAPAAW
jgi:ATP-dependent RNA helicase DDX3X